MSDSQPDKRREALIAMLNDIGFTAAQPPVDGFHKRSISLYVEDECDAGGEFRVSYTLDHDDVQALLTALGGWLVSTPSHALEIDCPKCKGSGTMDVMTQGYGPDDHLESVQCDGCKGTGTTPSTTPQKTGSETPRMDAALGKGADWVFAQGCQLEREYNDLLRTEKTFDEAVLAKAASAASAIAHIDAQHLAEKRLAVIEECRAAVFHRFRKATQHNLVKSVLEVLDSLKNSPDGGTKA